MTREAWNTPRLVALNSGSEESGKSPWRSEGTLGSFDFGPDHGDQVDGPS
jgi:hypothetical protein